MCGMRSGLPENGGRCLFLAHLTGIRHPQASPLHSSWHSCPLYHLSTASVQPYASTALLSRVPGRSHQDTSMLLKKSTIPKFNAQWGPSLRGLAVRVAAVFIVSQEVTMLEPSTANPVQELQTTGPMMGCRTQGENCISAWLAVAVSPFWHLQLMQDLAGFGMRGSFMKRSLACCQC